MSIMIKYTLSFVPVWSLQPLCYKSLDKQHFYMKTSRQNEYDVISDTDLPTLFQQSTVLP